MCGKIEPTVEKEEVKYPAEIKYRKQAII